MKKLSIGGTSRSFPDFAVLNSTKKFSQIPGLRSKTGKKNVTRLEPKNPGMNPAQRIATQLMRQVEAPLAADLPNSQEHVIQHEDNDDFGDNLDNDWGKIEMDDGEDGKPLLKEPGEDPEEDERNWDSSSTEPESGEEEEHKEWEARRMARWEQYQRVKRIENSRRRKNREGSLRESEDEQRNEDLEDFEVHRQEARLREELRLQEEFRRLNEACQLDEVRRLEEVRRREEVRLQEEARRKDDALRREEARQKEKRVQQEIERRVEAHRRGLEESSKELDVDPRPAKARRKDVMPEDRKEEGPSRKLTISIPPTTRATAKRVLFIHNVLFFPPLIKKI